MNSNPSLLESIYLAFLYTSVAWVVIILGRFLLVAPYSLWKTQTDRATAAEREVKIRLTPLLVVSFDNAADDCNKPILANTAYGFQKGKSLRVKVVCASDVNVINSAAFLTRIEHRPLGGAFVDVPLNEPTHLHWALQEPTPFDPITVYPRVARYVGICHSYENQPHFLIRLKHRSYVTPQLFAEPGDYRFGIEIVADNAPTISRAVVVTWNGKWDEIAACLVENT
jgi:hypothetical protein